MGDGTGRRWSLRRRSLGWSGPHGYWLRPTRVGGDYTGEDAQYYFRVQKVEEFDLNRDLIKE